jgi:hypothetical protein
MLPNDKLLATLASLVLSSTALAQSTPYNRFVRAADIAYGPSSDGGLQISGAVLLASDPDMNRNLSCFATLRVNGVEIPGGGIGGGTAQRLIIGPGIFIHPSAPANCEVFCIQNCLGPPPGFCVPVSPLMCLCDSSARVVPSPGPGFAFVIPISSLHAGDRITITVAPAPSIGGLPELIASDDSATRVVTSTPCPADYSGDGQIDVRDYLAFLSLYAAADPHADINTDARIDVADYLSFLSLFSRGC